MRKAININDLQEFDMAQYIKNDADIVEYLNQVLEDGDPGAGIGIGAYCQGTGYGRNRSNQRYQTGSPLQGPTSK